MDTNMAGVSSRPQRTIHTRHWGRLLTTVMTIAAVLFGSLPAFAGAVFKEGEEYHDQFEFEDCGVVIDDEQAGKWSLLVGPRGADQLAYFQFRVKGFESYTNTVTGKALTVEFSLLEKDHRIVDNGDGTLTITALVALNSTIRADEGNIVRKRSGTFSYQVLVDHNGTPQLPDDDTFLEDLGLIKEAGLDTFAGADFCEDFIAYTT